MRIADFLREQQVTFEALPHPPAFSAQKLAKYLRVSGRTVVKCVLWQGPKGPFLAVLPATRLTDVAALARFLGGPVRLATDEEIAEVFRDCEWGVVAPFGTLYGLPTILEDSLSPETEIVVEGQTRVEAIRIRCRDFEYLERPRRLAFALPAPLAREA